MAAEFTLGGVRRAPAREALAPSWEGASGIAFAGVTVAYGGASVLKDLELTIPPGEIVALIGPSGSGKTTALRAVAGFVRPTRGTIRIGDRDVTDLPPYARDIGMVVQNYALFPHMRVAENVAFGLRARRVAEAMIAERVRKCLQMVGMVDFARRYPRELSGGQQQRVAIARALAIRPRVLLLDEPLSALDAQIRRNMLEELARLHRELPGLTILYVTHDQAEALTLADRIAILRDGRLVAYGPSQALYRRPPNRFAAEFLGRANLLPVLVDHLCENGKLAAVRFGRDLLLAQPHPQLRAGDDCFLCIRPHEVSLVAFAEPANAVSATVQSVVWQGDLHSIALTTHDSLVRVVCAPLRDPPRPGDALLLHFATENSILIPFDAPADV
jgi:2-aminoethylphosphonate transport system ATP-binding protein